VSDSDILICGIDGKLNVIFDDRYASSHKTPILDRENGGKDDWELVHVTKGNNGILVN
jgi:hypothetical protein